MSISSFDDVFTNAAVVVVFMYHISDIFNRTIDTFFLRLKEKLVTVSSRSIGRLNVYLPDYPRVSESR